jgi:hypothetical protein
MVSDLMEKAIDMLYVYYKVLKEMNLCITCEHCLFMDVGNNVNCKKLGEILAKKRCIYYKPKEGSIENQLKGEDQK